MSGVINLLLTHQSPAAIQRMIEWWEHYVPAESLLVAFNGSLQDFEKIGHQKKIHLLDARLSTQQHQKEFQSYSGLFQTAAAFLETADYSHLHFCEYDHLPLKQELNTFQLQMLQQEKADVLGYYVGQIDNTNHPHYLYHLANPNFSSYWKSISCRKETHTILSMFGSGSFWTREAFEAVAEHKEPFPIYLEIYLPTTAHHLGFRVRNYPHSPRYIQVRESLEKLLPQAQKENAYSIHPVKKIWLEDAPNF